MEAQTPMLKQYHSIKKQHSDCILLFRLGDFYEMFYDDAKLASKALDLVLTSRGKDKTKSIPMCGFPHHASENYIARLIKAGYKVSICEQTEDPTQAQGIVKRDVIRTITSGTYIDENSSDSRMILSLSQNGKKIGFAFTDSTGGNIQSNEIPLNTNIITQIISRLPIYECIFPENQESIIKNIFNDSNIKSRNITLSTYQDWSFNADIARKSLLEHFKIANLHGFGIEDKLYAISSCGGLLEYLKEMNKQPLKHIDKISLYSDENYCFISPAAYRGLELESVINCLDLTTTAMGKRKFRFWFYQPLKNIADIEQRQDAINSLIENETTQENIKSIFNKIGDLEKNITRLSCGYTHAKDFLAIKNTLNKIPELKGELTAIKKQNPLFNIDDIKPLRELLDKTINDSVSLSNPDGNVINKGYNDELDELKNIQQNGREWLKNFQQKEIKESGINSLKVGFNKVFGYYIEITKTHSKNAPNTYIRKQTLVNAERYITPELKEYEEKILTAQDKILKIESKILQDIGREILSNSNQLHDFCTSIATIDCILGLSFVAKWNGYIRPAITNNSILDIKEGRHPVVEKSTKEPFISNNTLLDTTDNHLLILTGPNMSGKSTYIRQTAILVIMAQIGSFIPAKSAAIGIVDKVFTRIGAHDDISKGQSTFMVEMNEAADILNNLTDKSLVILDEIGRGTSTYDGLSLAWAIAEHLQNTKTRTLFATHFHELTALSDKSKGTKNYNVAVKKWEDEIIFLHKIIEGSTDDSYGIYVAKLAGIPVDVIKRARQVLTQLELKNDLKQNLKNNYNSSNNKNADSSEESQLSLFTNKDPIAEAVINTIKAIDINNVTPISALNKINELKEMIK